MQKSHKVAFPAGRGAAGQGDEEVQQFVHVIQAILRCATLCKKALILCTEENVTKQGVQLRTPPVT